MALLHGLEQKLLYHRIAVRYGSCHRWSVNSVKTNDSRVSLLAVSGYGAIARYYTPNPYTPTSVEWAKGMLTVSMATNIIVTLLTAGKIWSVF